MRRRMVQTRSAQLIAMQTQFMRSGARRPSSDELKSMQREQIEAWLSEANVASGCWPTVVQNAQCQDRAPGARGLSRC